MRTSPVPDLDCCQTQVIVAQGAPGNDGATGPAGADGSNAWTTTTTEFTMPAIGSAVVVEVVDSRWMVPWSSGGLVFGQIIAVQFAGNLPASDVPDDTHVELTNMGFTGCAVAGTVIPAGSRIGVSGVYSTITFNASGSNLLEGHGPPAAPPVDPTQIWIYFDIDNGDQMYRWNPSTGW